MTYLSLVNAVLRRLREEEVATVADTDYSNLIGDFVNDAKRQVEDAWDWTALRTTTTITTIAGTEKYSLTDYGVRSKILYVHNDTFKLFNMHLALHYVSVARQVDSLQWNKQRLLNKN